MQIRVHPDGSLSIEEEDDTSRFSIVEREPGQGRKALSAIGSPAEGDHYWLDADHVMALSSKSQDARWVKNYRAMLENAERFGYFDRETNRVKAHIEQDN